MFLTAVWRRSTLARSIAGLMAVDGLIVAGVFAYERVTLLRDQNGSSSRTAPAQPWITVDVPGVSRPATLTAAEAALPGGEAVVGVVVGGRARAYRLGALASRMRHVVNDRVGGTPVSVTYCDMSDCVQVYTDATAADPLNVRIAGLYAGQGMVLQRDGAFFLQKSGRAVRPGVVGIGDAIACETLPALRTTWDEWKRLYPGTDVYVGDGTP